MKKMMKQNKGFSLIELLVAILIMALIAGTAIMLFGGVLGQSRTKADEETAEAIKRAVLTYINSSNDSNLSMLGFKSGGSDEQLLQALCCVIKIDKSAPSLEFSVPTNAPVSFSKPTGLTPEFDGSDLDGSYGPLLDVTKGLKPQDPKMVGWEIKVDDDTQVITVRAVDKDAGVTIN